MAAELRPLRDGDLEALVADLRDRDRDEIIATLGPCDVLARLRESVADSGRCWAFADGDQLLGVCGCACLSLLAGTGSPWFLGTRAVDRRPVELTWWSRRYIGWVKTQYSGLVNYVDARNRRSVRWLAALGFTVDAAAPWGAAGLPFHRFHSGDV